MFYTCRFTGHPFYGVIVYSKLYDIRSDNALTSNVDDVKFPLNKYL